MAQAQTSKKKTGRPPKPPGEKFVYIGIRLPPEEAEAVRAMAAGRTPQQVVRELVSEALAARERRSHQKRARGG